MNLLILSILLRLAEVCNKSYYEYENKICFQVVSSDMLREINASICSPSASVLLNSYHKEKFCNFDITVPKNDFSKIGSYTLFFVKNHSYNANTGAVCNVRFYNAHDEFILYRISAKDAKILMRTLQTKRLDDSSAQSSYTSVIESFEKSINDFL